MPPFKPRTDLATHTVENQPPPLTDWNLYQSDAALREAVARSGATWAEARLDHFGARMGAAETMEAADLANRIRPELQLFDRAGRRIDEVRFHPAYHQLMTLGLEAGIASLPWTHQGPGGHVAHVALEYMLSQTEPGVCCPITMTYAAVPALAAEPEVAAAWTPKLTTPAYDPRSIPAAEKTACTLGMAMTEKQGGSDVRANTTRAEAVADGYILNGHKWFCSAPMSDAFLTIAQTDAGPTCFLVPRWTPDGTRNRIEIQRLKDKLGNWSNASSEIEYRGAWATRIGEEGRGIRTIIEMVHHTRLDTAQAPASFVRRAFVEAAHHAVHRRAFQRRLIDQPLMAAVLADLAIEAEAAIALVVRVAAAFDAADDPIERAFSRLAVAVAKFWLNKRCPAMVYEAMECLGGGGYVEESIMPRLYREAPLNAIWEGSGNVICLDVLRTLVREEAALPALLAELELARGAAQAYDARLDGLTARIRAVTEAEARGLIAEIAVLLQASLVLRHAPAMVADAFIATRLDAIQPVVAGNLPKATPARDIIARHWPEAA